MPPEKKPAAEDQPLLRKISVNVDRVDYDWLRDNIEDAKRLRVLPPRATISDVINEGFRRRVSEVQEAVAAAKKRAKK